MKWRTKPETKLDDTRIIRAFAWWPMDLDGGQTVWLESYSAEQVYAWTLFYGMDFPVPVRGLKWKTIRRFQ